MSKISDTTNKIAELKKDIAELELSLNDELKQSFQNFDVTTDKGFCAFQVQTDDGWGTDRMDWPLRGGGNGCTRGCILLNDYMVLTGQSFNGAHSESAEEE